MPVSLASRHGVFCAYTSSEDYISPLYAAAFNLVHDFRVHFWAYWLARWCIIFRHISEFLAFSWFCLDIPSAHYALSFLNTSSHEVNIRIDIYCGIGRAQLL